MFYDMGGGLVYDPDGVDPSWDRTQPYPSVINNINDDLESLKERLIQLREENEGALTRHTENLRALQRELFEAKGADEITVAGQYVLDQSFAKLRDVYKNVSTKHREVHGSVSKVGRDIDRYMCKNMQFLLKNQKLIEADEQSRHGALILMMKHFISKGYFATAQTFAEEFNVQMEPDAVIADRQRIAEVEEALGEARYSAVEQYCRSLNPVNIDMLISVHMLRLMELASRCETEWDDLVRYVRANLTDIMQPEALRKLMGAIFSQKHGAKYDAVLGQEEFGRHEKLVLQGLVGKDSHLYILVDAGAGAIHMLFNMRALILTRQDFLFSGEELPIEVRVPRHHSTLNCPILRQQITSRNPAVRLNCGHVISTEAMNRLAQASRVYRLKCPYCPTESTPTEAHTIIL